jgi:hypothetical protein
MAKPTRSILPVPSPFWTDAGSSAAVIAFSLSVRELCVLEFSSVESFGIGAGPPKQSHRPQVLPARRVGQSAGWSGALCRAGRRCDQQQLSRLSLADMVLNQPSMPKAAWETEIAKMRNVYKAPVAESDVPSIVDYLVRIKGAK